MKKRGLPDAYRYRLPQSSLSHCLLGVWCQRSGLSPLLQRSGGKCFVRFVLRSIRPYTKEHRLIYVGMSRCPCGSYRFWGNPVSFW